VTVAEGLYLVGVVLLEVPTGAFADRAGRSRSLAVGALCLCGSVVLFAFVQDFGLLLASFLLWSFASTLTSGADLALLFETLKSANRESEYERLTGWATALNWGGVGIATLIGGPLAAAFGIRFTIFVGAATCLVTAGVALAIPEPRHVVVHGEARRGSYFGAIRGAFGELWRQADVRALVLLAGTAGAALEAITYLTQPYLVDRGIDVGVMFSLLQVPIFMAGIAGALLAGRARNPGMAVRTLVLVPVAGVFGYAVLAVAPGLTGFAAFPLAVALGSSIRPLSSGYVNRRIGSERRATVLSIEAMVLSLVLAGLAPGIGFATDQWGVWAAFVAGGTATAVAWLCFAPALLGSPKAAVALSEAEAA
jgi:MFS family permease